MIPQIQKIDQIPLPVVNHITVGDSIPFYSIIKKNCNVIKLEFVFFAGRPFESKQMIATTCGGLLKEGAGPYGADQIAELFDFYGASLEVRSTFDTISLVLTCLKKHLGKFIGLLSNILAEPAFLDEELDLLVKRRLEKLKVDLTKNDVLTYRHLTEAIFGHQHPYGYNSSAEAYKAVSTADLKKHFLKYFNASSCYIFGAGDIGDAELLMIEKIARAVRPQDAVISGLAPVPSSHNLRQHSVPGAPTQSSIKIGRRMFRRNHPDYQGMSFLNVLFGGYFGSRLVSSLREEKGMTYGVYSSLDSFFFDGTFVISTEVANENVEYVIEEIFKEMQKLQEESITVSEINHVRNYVMGSYLNLFDGPFNSIRTIKSLVLSQIPMSDIESLIDISKSIGPNRIKSLAHKYFNRNDFWEVVAGSNSKCRRE